MTAEVKLTIDLTNVEQRKLLNALFDLVGSNEKKPETKTTTKAEKEVRETKAKEKTAKRVDKPTAKADTVVGKKSDGAVGINDIRALVSQKAATHRQELKAKLTELGAKNVTTLDKTKYVEFAEYLNSL